VKIPSDIRYIRKASKEIEDFLKSRGVDGDTIFDIRLTVEEAVKNAIIHGNKKEKGKSVSLSYSLKDEKFRVEVEDEGNGFRPDSLPDPTLDEHIYAEGGRGVFLINKLMDEVKYNERGNKVSMIKYISAKGGRNAN